MNEYSGTSAQNYKQSAGKQILLLPALGRHIPQVEEGNLLDLGCGTADMFPLLSQRGYRYLGLDISEDMLQIAKERFPKGQFLQAAATDFAHLLEIQFEIVLANMIFPCFSSFEDIKQSLQEMRQVLVPGGKVIIGVAHPCFDPYVQKGLFDRPDTDAHFQSYFSAGDRYVIHKQFDSGSMSFTDYHWPLGEYIRAITESGLTLRVLDECPPDLSQQVEWDSSFNEQRLQIPSYLVLVCE